MNNVVVLIGETAGMPIYGVETDEKVATFSDAAAAFLYVAGRQLLHRQLRNVFLMDMNDPSSPPEWWDDFAERFIPRRFAPLIQPVFVAPPPGTPVLSNDGAPPAGGANWVSAKTRREAGQLYFVREQPADDGNGSVLYVERDGEPLGSFWDDGDWTEAFTYVAARQILMDSPGGVWVQPWGYPTPYRFEGFDAQYIPPDLVATMYAAPQLSAPAWQPGMG